MDSDLRDRLLTYSASIERRELFPGREEAIAFALKSPFAFTLACCLDRGNSEVIWAIPFELNSLLGHLDPQKMRALSLKDLTNLFTSLTKKPRFINDAPRTSMELIAIVCDEFSGDAAKIWESRPPQDVVRTLRRIHGVGEGIANMTVLLIERAFPMRFSEEARPSMNIKADVHTMRVLYRLGVSSRQSETETVQAAKRLNPSFPGALDAGLWLLGHKYCHSSNPRCTECPMTNACAHRI